MPVTSSTQLGVCFTYVSPHTSEWEKRREIWPPSVWFRAGFLLLILSQGLLIFGCLYNWFLKIPWGSESADKVIVQSNTGHNSIWWKLCHSVKRKRRAIVTECIVVMANMSVGLKCKETGRVDLVGFSFLSSHHSAFVNTHMLYWSGWHMVGHDGVLQSGSGVDCGGFCEIWVVWLANWTVIA